MIKYEVRTFNVERWEKSKQTAEEIWRNSNNQDTTLLESFDTLESARLYYDSVPTECRYECYGRYYDHSCKCIEMNEYDDDGEWVAGGDWFEADFGEMDEDIDDADFGEIDEDIDD